jgi:opacity protein-like surface antigen
LEAIPVAKSILSIAAGAALLAFTVPAMAADLIVDTPPVMDTTSSINWEGAYIGGVLGYYPTFGGPVVGGEIGYDFTPSENFLLGIEGSVLFGNGFIDSFIKGKAGFVAGNAAFYGLAAIGPASGGVIYKFGVGAEFRIDQNWGIDGEIAGANFIGAAPVNPYVQIGVRYHF